MEKFKKLSKEEMKNVTGGIVGHRVHCVTPPDDHIVGADICPADGGLALCHASGYYPAYAYCT
jgi:bacteriocin-like protein